MKASNVATGGNMFKAIGIMILGCILFALVFVMVLAGACYLGMPAEIASLLAPVGGLLFGMPWGMYCAERWGRR